MIKKTIVILLVIVMILSSLCACADTLEQPQTISKFDAVPIAKQAAIEVYEEKHGTLIPPENSTSNGVCFTSIQDLSDTYRFSGWIITAVEEGMLSQGEYAVSVTISKTTGKVVSSELG